MPHYGGDFDRRFLLDTITHHQIAAEMLAICGQKSKQAKLTALCEELGSAPAGADSNPADVAHRLVRRPAQSAGPSTRAHDQRLQDISGNGQIRYRGEVLEEAFLRGMRLHHLQRLAEPPSSTKSVRREPRFLGKLTSEQQRDIQLIGKYIHE